MTDIFEHTIEARGLTKSYEGHLAVDALDLVVRPGRVLGLVGPNGAGKTTSMRCMAGIIPPTSGRVTIAGHDLIDEPLAAKGRLAFVPDTPHLFDYLTVEEHLRFMGRIHQLPEVDERIDALLAEFELADRRRHLPGALSRGMKQKLAITIGFLHDPSAIFLDEPLTGLDPLGIRRMREAIALRAREQAAAVIVSSHQLELVEAICDEILIMKNGRSVVQGSLDDIRAQLDGLPENPRLEDIFFRLTEIREDGPSEEPVG